MAERGSLIPALLRENARFKNDFADVLSVPEESVGQAIVAMRELGSRKDERGLSDLVELTGMSAERLAAVMAMLSFLASRGAAVDLPAAEAMSQLEQFASEIERRDDFTKRAAALSTLFGQEIAKGAVAEQALDLGMGTFLEADFKPVFVVPDTKPGLVVGGLLFTVSYHDPNSDHRALSLALAPHDARRVLSALRDSLEELDNLLRAGKVEIFNRMDEDIHERQ